MPDYLSKIEMVAEQFVHERSYIDFILNKGKEDSGIRDLPHQNEPFDVVFPDHHFLDFHRCQSL